MSSISTLIFKFKSPGSIREPFAILPGSNNSIFFILACLTIRQNLVIKMITVVIAENKEKVREMLTQILDKVGNTNINIIKEGGTVKITEKDSLKDLVPLEDKIIELEDSLYNEKKGTLYKSILEVIEKPLIEHILERTEGNQFKAARILGINRNTMRAKIKRLGINPLAYKQY
jgi:DNA-binding protein Fis